MLKNSLWVMLGQGSRIALVALLFLVLARGLGAEDFGIYMTMFAVSQILFPLSGLGTHNSLVMRVSRRPRLLRPYMGTPLLATLIAGGILSLLAAAGFTLFYGHPGLKVALPVFLTELVAYRLLDVATHSWQAMDQLKKYALAYTALSMIRLAAGTLLWLAGLLDLLSWAWLNLLLTLGVAAAVLGWLMHSEKIKLSQLRFFRSELATGIHFSVSGIGQAVFSNTDKILISRLLGNEAVGIYAVAQRAAQMAFLPAQAVFMANYARYFQSGRKGLAATLQFSRQMAPALLGYGMVASMGCFLLAPLLPWVFGEQYREASHLLRLLSLLPLIQVAHFLLGEAMTGSGMQGIRSLLQFGAGIIGCGILYFMLEQHGLGGAAMTALISESMLLFAYLSYMQMTRKS